jgi:hypothetical protein
MIRTPAHVAAPADEAKVSAATEMAKNNLDAFFIENFPLYE